MNNELAQLKKDYRETRYDVRENDWDIVYKEALFDRKKFRSYNFKKEQQKIADLVNKQNKICIEYAIFYKWLLANDLIQQHTIDTFYDYLHENNQVIEQIRKYARDYEDAKAIYEKLKEMGYLIEKTEENEK